MCVCVRGFSRERNMSLKFSDQSFSKKRRCAPNKSREVPTQIAVDPGR